MANWSTLPWKKWKSSEKFLHTLFLSTFITTSSFATIPPFGALWGFYGHQRINRMAVFLLPPPIFGLFKQHIEFLTEHAVDPDKRRYAVDGEAQRHFIDIDHYASDSLDPFLAVPQNWTKACEKFSEDTLQAYGIVPWHIVVMKFRLQKAFEEKNLEAILNYAADLGHYIGDAHVPLHTTENYNGQLTNQKGIHGLWESRLVELHANDYDYWIGKSMYISNVTKFAWDAVKGSNLALDSVLRLEKTISSEFTADKKYTYEQRGGVLTQVYSVEFSNAYHLALNGMVERRMKAAILGVASVWYTAWVDAGQPDLNELLNKKPSPELLKAIAEMEKMANSKQKSAIRCDDH